MYFPPQRQTLHLWIFQSSSLILFCSLLSSEKWESWAIVWMNCHDRWSLVPDLHAASLLQEISISVCSVSWKLMCVERQPNSRSEWGRISIFTGCAHVAWNNRRSLFLSNTKWAQTGGSAAHSQGNGCELKEQDMSSCFFFFLIPLFLVQCCKNRWLVPQELSNVPNLW